MEARPVVGEERGHTGDDQSGTEGQEEAVDEGAPLTPPLAKQRAAPTAKRGKSAKAKGRPVKEPSLRDMVTEAVRDDAGRANA